MKIEIIPNRLKESFPEAHKDRPFDLVIHSTSYHPVLGKDTPSESHYEKTEEEILQLIHKLQEDYKKVKSHFGLDRSDENSIDRNIEAFMSLFGKPPFYLEFRNFILTFQEKLAKENPKADVLGMIFNYDGHDWDEFWEICIISLLEEVNYNLVAYYHLAEKISDENLLIIQVYHFFNKYIKNLKKEIRLKLKKEGITEIDISKLGKQ